MSVNKGFTVAAAALALSATTAQTGIAFFLGDSKTCPTTGTTLTPACLPATLAHVLFRIGLTIGHLLLADYLVSLLCAAGWWVMAACMFSM